MIPKETDLDLERGLVDREDEKNQPKIANSRIIREDDEETLITDAEKKNTTKKKKKPPKPPRPPRAVSLDAADEKLIQHLSELAMLKRARVERMKALMKMKNNNKTGSSSASSFWPLLVTLLFCVIIVWQGFSSRSHSRGSYAGSPESSVANGRMIQVQYLRNAFPSDSASPVSASPRSLRVGWRKQGKRGR